MFENRIILNVIIAGMMFAFIFFLFDVVFDLRDHFSDGLSYSTDEVIHLVFEGGAVLALFFGMVSVFKSFINIYSFRVSIYIAFRN